MNNPNPFVPKGSLLEQQSQRRSRLKLAVFCILAVSVTGLVATLIMGCNHEKPETQTSPADTNTTPPFEMTSTSNPTSTTGNLAAQMPVTSNTAPVTMTPVQTPVQSPVQLPAVVETPATSTYEVVSGDTLDHIAKAHGISVKALEAANPGVDPKKLHPKQKLNLPAPTPSATNAQPGTAAATESGGAIYSVKPGDSLAKIARNHGISLKALRAANPKYATTDHIRVGDKLTIPAKAETAAPATPTPAADTSISPATPPMQTPPPTSNPAH